MMRIDLIAKSGGVFATLVFIHFVVDWVFQSHAAAMAKSTNSRIRGIHCAIYTAPFGVYMKLLGLSFPRISIGLLVLFVSHFFEDTYIPVLLWAKHVRKPPEFDYVGLPTQEKDIAAFKLFMGTPLGILLGITIDQLIHLGFLWVVVGLILWP